MELTTRVPSSRPKGEELALVIAAGDKTDAALPIQTDVVAIGRDPGNDLVLDDPSVSRRHAEIRRESGSFYIYDRGSLNGTYVHRIRIDRTRLADGDELQLGRTRLIFWSGEIKGAGDPH